MTDQDDIVAIMAGLEVAGEPSLFIMLGDDGSITRMGRGEADNRDREMFVGKPVARTAGVAVRVSFVSPRAGQQLERQKQFRNSVRRR